MAKEELFEEIDTSSGFLQTYLGLSLGRFLMLVFVVIFFGIYLGVVLYGTNSMEVLLNLEDYEHYLKEEVVHLKAENAQLQREYFELKEISAQ